MLLKWLRLIYYKKLTFYRIVLVFFLTGCTEIVFRVFLTPTPISFLFPGYIFAMYLKITQKRIGVREQWCLLLPFFLFIFFLVFLLIITYSPETDLVWTQSYLTVYVLLDFIYMFSIISGLQKRFYSEYDSLSLFYIQFVSLTQLVGALLLLVLLNMDKQILLAGALPEKLNQQWKILLSPVVAVLLSFQYLVLMRRSNNVEYPLTARMKEYKKEIIYLFNEQKIFLNPDLTLNMLSRESKIDKSELEFFFSGYIGKNFHYFVAEYRIANAIKMITEEGDRYTLEAIGYECGFRNKATFNKYFKLITGMLPSEYLNTKNRR